MAIWGNQCGYGRIRASRSEPCSPEEVLASLERELASRRQAYGDSPFTQEQIGRIAEFKKNHTELVDAEKA